MRQTQIELQAVTVDFGRRSGIHILGTYPPQTAHAGYDGSVPGASKRPQIHILATKRHSRPTTYKKSKNCWLHPIVKTKQKVRPGTLR